MTQLKSDLVKNLGNIFTLIIVSIISFIYKFYIAGALLAFAAVVNTVIYFICYKKVEIIKTLPVENSSVKNIENTVEQQLFDEICSYALDKGLNPCIDAAPNGFFLNESIDNKSIGICEIVMPISGTKYMSDAYKGAVERVKEKIDEFIKDNPALIGGKANA